MKKIRVSAAMAAGVVAVVAVGLITSACSGGSGAEPVGQEGQAIGIGHPLCPEIIPFCPPNGSLQCTEENGCRVCVCNVPQAIELAPAVDPWRIAVDMNNVYWTDREIDGGSLMSVPIGGGSATNLASGQTNISNVAILYESLSPAIRADAVDPLVENSAAAEIFWLVPGGIWRVSALVGNAVAFSPAYQEVGFSLNTNPLSLTTDYGHMYWTIGLGAVESYPVRGGSFVTLAQEHGDPTAIAVDSTNVYWVDQVYGVQKEPVLANNAPGGPVVTLLPGPNGASHIALDSAPVQGSNATHVYFTDSVTGTVMSVPASGGAPVTLASGQSEPRGIAVDGANVYWANEGDGTINSVPVGGGSVTVLASNQIPIELVVDSTSVYWTNSAIVDVTGTVLANGNVMKIAK